MIEMTRGDTIIVVTTVLLLSGFTYAFISLPPTATLVRTLQAIVVSKDSYVSLVMFIPMGDNIVGVPLFEQVYMVTASTGDQINVSRGQYDSLNAGSQIVVQFWSKGWLDWKTCEIY